MAAPIRLAPEVVIGTPLKLFEIPADLTGEFDVVPDSKKFVMIRRGTQAGSQPVRWVSCRTGWRISSGRADLAVKAANSNESVQS
jgi:hypothetical protein